MFSVVSYAKGQTKFWTKSHTTEPAGSHVPLLPLENKNHPLRDIFFKARTKTHKTPDQKKAAVRKAQIKYRLSQEASIRQLEDAYREKFRKDPQLLKPLPAKRGRSADEEEKNRTKQEKNRRRQADFKMRRRIYVQRLEAELAKESVVPTQEMPSAAQVFFQIQPFFETQPFFQTQSVYQAQPFFETQSFFPDQSLNPFRQVKYLIKSKL